MTTKGGSVGETEGVPGPVLVLVPMGPLVGRVVASRVGAPIAAAGVPPDDGLNGLGPPSSLLQARRKAAMMAGRESAMTNLFIGVMVRVS